MTDGDRLEAVLAERELADPRPLYRDLLRELRDEDPEGYEEAVERYREEVEPADSLEAWVSYGRWLASRLAPGRAVIVDRSGRSREPDGGAPPAACLLLHLPESTSRRAIALAVPSEPTEHQEETRELLC